MSKEERINELFPIIEEALKGSRYSSKKNKTHINVLRNGDIITSIYSRIDKVRFEAKKGRVNIKQLDDTNMVLKEPQAHIDNKNLYVFYVLDRDLECVLRRLFNDNPIENEDNNQIKIQAKLKADQEIIDEIKKSNLVGVEKEALVRIRVNQGIFRDKLLKKYNKCCLCYVKCKKLLIASHIKPWAASNKNEKLDENNGFLLCPNHDALFDKGFITFEDDGTIKISELLSEQDKLFLNVKNDMKIAVNDENRKYLEYHRNLHKDKVD